jgi:hypothetical protein
LGSGLGRDCPDDLFFFGSGPAKRDGGGQPVDCRADQRKRGEHEPKRETGSCGEGYESQGRSCTKR